MAKRARQDPANAEQGGSVVDQEGFLLGTPSLVCRWRLYHQRLPLANRHLRALRSRRVQGRLVPTELVAWVKQHLEWTLEKGSAEEPDGVLMLVVDEGGKAALTVGPYEELRGKALSALARRAMGAATEARSTGVAPETLWIVRDGTLIAGIEEGQSASGTASLVFDLAHTLGIPAQRQGHLANEIVSHASQVPFDEAFLVSDEHGVVCASNASGPLSGRLFDSYLRLLERQGSHRR